MKSPRHMLELHHSNASYRMNTSHRHPVRRSAMAYPIMRGSGHSRTSPRRSVLPATRGGSNGSTRTRPIADVVIEPSRPIKEDEDEDPFRTLFWQASPDAFGADEEEDRVESILRTIAPQITFPERFRLQHFRYIRGVVEWCEERVVLFQDAHAKYQTLAGTYDMPHNHPGYEVTFKKPDNTPCTFIMIPFNPYFHFPFILLLDGPSPPIRITDVNHQYDLYVRNVAVDDYDLRGIHAAIVDEHFQEDDDEDDDDDDA